MVHDLLAPGPQERYDLDANDESLPRLQEWMNHHGDICRVPSESRPGDGLVIHDAEAIRHVLLTNRANYVKGVGMERVRLLLGNGLMVSEGDFWSRQRRMVQPAFQSQVIRSFSASMERANQKLIERWSGHARRGEPIHLTRDLSELTLNIVLHALFSADLDGLANADGSSPFDLLTRETRRDIPFAAKFRALTHLVRGVIAARRADRRIEMDLLSTLMEARDRDSGEAMPERALLDEIMTLIVAGHETTASALNWTWYLLSQNVEVEERLHQALVGESLEENPFVEQVLMEALRLYPPGWLFSRRALGDDELSGYHVAAGTDIFICPYLLHRHPAHWDRPEMFDPDRFTAAAVEARHRFAFLPFSAGPRYCIGATFAMAEMKTHLSLLAREFRLSYVGADLPKPEFQINLRTQQDLLMRVAAR